MTIELREQKSCKAISRSFAKHILGEMELFLLVSKSSVPKSCFAVRYKETTGKSVETLEREKASKAMLESQNKAQVEFNCELQDEVAQIRAQLSMAQTNGERQAGKLVESESQRRELEAALEAALSKVREGEIIRRKLHNTILVSARYLQQLRICKDNVSSLV